MNESHFRRLEQMYLSAHINSKVFTSTTVKISEEHATIGLMADSDYFHALGALHGSVYFKLLDDAAFFAVSSIVTDVFVLTTSFNINLVRPVTGGRLRSEGKVRFKSRHMFVGESVLYNEDGKEVAFGTGQFAKSKGKLADLASYANAQW